MKKVLVLILALAMVMTSFVMPAMAEDDLVKLHLGVRLEGEEEALMTILGEIGEVLGIEFEVDLYEEEVSEKYTTMFMSGDYPEVLVNPQFSNAQLIEYGSEEGILIAIEDYLNADVTPNLNARLEEKPAWRQMMTMPDGHIYGVPSADSNGGGHGDVSYKMHINTEWLDAVGMEMPTTLDGFCDVLRAFKEKDPNGNGIADEVGLMGCVGTWSGDVHLNLLNCFGVFQESFYYVQDGEVKPCANTDYIREGLSYINAMYEEGLIDPASFTQDLTQFGKVGNAEHVISGAITCGHAGMFFDVNDYDRFTGWTAVLPLEGPNGYRGTPYSKMASVSGSRYSLTDVCENVEMAMRFADLTVDDYWVVRHQVGVKGVMWDDADEGTTGMGGTPAEYKYLQGYGNTEDNSVKGWGWTMRLLEPNWKAKFQVVGDYYDSANYENYVYSETIKQWDYAADIDTIPPLVFADADTSTEAATMSTNFSSYAKSAIAQFITGVIDIDDDATWEQYKADLEGFGYSEYLGIIQDTINAMGYGK